MFPARDIFRVHCDAWDLGRKLGTIAYFRACFRNIAGNKQCDNFGWHGRHSTSEGGQLTVVDDDDRQLLLRCAEKGTWCRCEQLASWVSGTGAEHVNLRRWRAKAVKDDGGLRANSLLVHFGGLSDGLSSFFCVARSCAVVQLRFSLAPVCQITLTERLPVLFATRNFH